MPGILDEVIEQYSLLIAQQSYNLSADLQRINSNTNTELGNVDLCGFEKTPSKQDTCIQE